MAGMARFRFRVAPAGRTIGPRWDWNLEVANRGAVGAKLHGGMNLKYSISALDFLTLLCLASPVVSPARDAEKPGMEFEPAIRQRLEWFQDLKFGFMMHWGVYSQWGCIESWPLVEEDKWARPDDLKAWTGREKDMERFRKDYWLLSTTFNPDKFDPARWARAAKGAGMKYVIFTTKHHDGFCLFDTRQTDYRVTAPGVPFHANPGSNVVREVFNACLLYTSDAADE